MSNFKITTLTAFVAVDQHTGDEGIIGLPAGGLLSSPAIGADEDRLRSLFPIVLQLCQILNIEFKILQFNFAEDITEEVKTKYGGQ